MKTSWSVILALVSTVAATCGPGATPAAADTADPTPAQTNPAPYAAVERGANHRVWQRTTYEKTASGQTIPRIHKYTELATGLHFQKDGQWVESKAEIEILASGAGATASQGQHKVTFPPDLYDGLIELHTPDAKWLRSRVLGLSYFDPVSGQSVLIAETSHSTGELHQPNEIVYPDAFTGLKADVRYRYTRAAFEQDIILREQFPSPAEYGLNPETTRLQVLTEFMAPPAPQIRVREVNGLADESLDFGAMQVGRGKAFTLGAERSGQRKVNVVKSWQKLEGRDFLIEEVPFERIRPQLQTLPLPASATASTGSAGSMLHQVSATRLLPPARLVRTGTNIMQLAKASLNNKPGVVLDYVTLNEGGYNGPLRGDTTYYVSGEVGFGDDTVIEGGTVVKFARGATLHFGYNVVCHRRRTH
jgi:hypothetical protein